MRERLPALLSGSKPVFTRYMANEDGGFHEWVQRTTAENIASFLTTRTELANLAKQFNDEQLAHTGKHPVIGERNVEQWCEFFLLHEAHHLFSIYMLVGQVR